MGRGIFPTMMGKLESKEPQTRSEKLAGVSVIIDGEVEPRTLLIRRANRQGDPWSGQVAFPGGRMQKGDSSALQTAIRETREEVGLDLSRDAEFLGYFGSFLTHTGDMEVVPSVFLMKRTREVVPNGEISGYRWIPFDSFLSPSSRSTYRFKAGGHSREMPAYIVGDYVVWGLTHRIISSLLGTEPSAA